MNKAPITRNETDYRTALIGSIGGAILGFLLNYLLSADNQLYLPVLVLFIGGATAIGMQIATKGQHISTGIRVVTSLIALIASASFMYYMKEEDLLSAVILVGGSTICAWLASKEGAVDLKQLEKRKP